MLDSLGAIKELYEASKGGEVLAAINHAAKMTISTLPFTGFSRSQIRSIPTRYDVRRARSFGTCSYKGYLASDERKHRRTAAEAYLFNLQMMDKIY